jgi:hypothetical protein
MLEINDEQLKVLIYLVRLRLSNENKRLKRGGRDLQQRDFIQQKVYQLNVLLERLEESWYQRNK